MRLQRIEDGHKKMIRERVMHAVQEDASIPAFSATVQKLNQLLRQQDIGIDDVSDVVKTDPGMTSKYLRLANSAAYGGRIEITSINIAMMRIGLRQIRMFALATGVLDSFRTLKIKVDWERFWLHSLLTARLAETLFSAYMKTEGKEYLAGLLHDVGKLFIQHYFPREFETIMLRAMERRKGMFSCEKKILNCTHAEVGSLICQKWKLHADIYRAVSYHHEPENAMIASSSLNKEQQLIIITVSLANQFANLYGINIKGAKILNIQSIEELPQWQLLQRFTPIHDFEFDIAEEIEIGQEIISAITG